jgi:hypothetical protein
MKTDVDQQRLHETECKYCTPAMGVRSYHNYLASAPGAYNLKSGLLMACLVGNAIRKGRHKSGSKQQSGVAWNSSRIASLFLTSEQSTNKFKGHAGTAVRGHGRMA